MDIVLQILLIGLIIWFAARKILPSKGITNLTVREAKDKLKDKNVQFIDVRTPQEYKANHRKPFKNIPLSNLRSHAGKLDKDREVVVICQSGMRSMQAAKLLKKQGFENVYNVKGGMNSWV